MANFFIIRNKEKNMYYWGYGSWTKIKDCARKHQHKDCAETLIQKDNLDYKNCEIVEIPSITDLEVKLKESEKKAKAYVKEIVFLDKKLENLNKEFELAQEHNGKTVEYWQDEYSQLKQQLAEKEKEIEIEKKVSDWLYDICNRTKFEEEVAQKYKTVTEITKQCDLYEHCKNQYINDLRSEVKKKLKY